MGQLSRLVFDGVLIEFLKFSAAALWLPTQKMLGKIRRPKNSWSARDFRSLEHGASFQEAAETPKKRLKRRWPQLHATWCFWIRFFAPGLWTRGVDVATSKFRVHHVCHISKMFGRVWQSKIRIWMDLGLPAFCGFVQVCERWIAGLCVRSEGFETELLGSLKNFRKEQGLETAKPLIHYVFVLNHLKKDLEKWPDPIPCRMFQTAKPKNPEPKPATGLISLKAKQICFQIVEGQGLTETQSLDLDEVEVTVRKLENPEDFMGFSQMLCFKAKGAADFRKVQELLRHRAELRFALLCQIQISRCGKKCWIEGFLHDCPAKPGWKHRTAAICYRRGGLT